MNSPDHDFDPDDNYADDADHDGLDEDAGVETLVWQLLLVINPGDDDAALQQFGAFQEALEAAGGDDAEVPELLREAIDWKSGFHVEEGQTGALVDALVELAARFNLDIDWGVEDPTDEGFLARVGSDALLATAQDQLRVEGYTLWSWDTGTDACAGWITRSSDDEAIRVLAPALGIEARPAAM